jgi:hypothetical protein
VLFNAKGTLFSMARAATGLIWVLVAVGTGLVAQPPNVKVAKKPAVAVKRSLVGVVLAEADIFGYCVTGEQLKDAPVSIEKEMESPLTIAGIKDKFEGAGYTWQSSGKKWIHLASRDPGTEIVNLVTGPVPPGSYTGFEVLKFALSHDPNMEIQLICDVWGSQCLARTIILEKEIKGTTLGDLMNVLTVRLEGNCWRLFPDIVEDKTGANPQTILYLALPSSTS